MVAYLEEAALEIPEFDLVVEADCDVFRPDVSVCYSARVTVLERPCEIEENLGERGRSTLRTCRSSMPRSQSFNMFWSIFARSSTTTLEPDISASYADRMLGCERTIWMACNSVRRNCAEINFEITRSCPWS